MCDRNLKTMSYSIKRSFCKTKHCKVFLQDIVAMLGWCGRRDLNPGVFSPFREAIRSVAGFRQRILFAVPVLDQARLRPRTCPKTSTGRIKPSFCSRQVGSNYCENNLDWALQCSYPTRTMLASIPSPLSHRIRMRFLGLHQNVSRRCDARNMSLRA